MKNTLNIGLFGLGTVGQAVCSVVSRAINAHAVIKRVCVRNLAKPRAIEIDPAILTDRPDDIFDDPDINLIVELVDNAEASLDIVSRGLASGKPVVSGNKAMIARHLPLLIELQHRYNTPLLYDASACGSIPVIRNLEEYYDNDLLLEVKGILNGSTNYILSRVFDHGESYDDALARAIRLGFAESDPSFDIDGFDALFKLIIITVHALGRYVAPADVFTLGIRRLSDFDIAYAREKGVKIKLVAQVAKVGDSSFTMFVMPELVARNKYIYSVDDEYNGVVIRGEDYDRQFMFGKGAGGRPTASSILSDITALRYGYRYEYKKMHFLDRPAYTTGIDLRLYIRYGSTDIPSKLPLRAIREQYISERGNYVIADVRLSDLIAHRDIITADDVFVANIPLFFADRD